VIRRDSKSDSFQRQIAALREQLAVGEPDDLPYDDAEPMPTDDAPAILSASVAATVSPVYAPRTPVTPAAVPRLDAVTGVIAADSRWNGTLTSHGSLHIYGAVEGQLTAHGEVYIAEGAQVDARLHAATVYVAGALSGTIECTERLEVLPTGRVDGDVSTATLVVHDGAVLSGSLRMREAEATEPPRP
jgi:cytoskeletal protein CcmA (bactofilin family)